MKATFLLILLAMCQEVGRSPIAYGFAVVAVLCLANIIRVSHYPGVISTLLSFLFMIEERGSISITLLIGHTLIWSH